MTTRVWDRVRGRWLVLTPEEGVRRDILAMLTGPKTAGGLGIAPTSIAQEYPIDLNGTTQRADIVVFDHSAQPLMLVECKAPEVAISDAVLAQAFRYNTVLGAHYVMLTNGRDHYVYQIGANNQYTPLSEFPDLLSRCRRSGPQL